MVQTLQGQWGVLIPQGKLRRGYILPRLHRKQGAGRLTGPPLDPAPEILRGWVSQSSGAWTRAGPCSVQTGLREQKRHKKSLSSLAPLAGGKVREVFLSILWPHSSSSDHLPPALLPAGAPFPRVTGIPAGTLWPPTVPWALTFLQVLARQGRLSPSALCTILTLDVEVLVGIPPDEWVGCVVVHRDTGPVLQVLHAWEEVG